MLHKKIRNFHETFNHPVSDTPVKLEHERKRVRFRWMLEELQEFLDSNTIVGDTDAMGDLIYLAIGTLVEMGVPYEQVIDIIHDANMSKLWEDGKPHFREDSKTIKPEGWVGPETKLEAYIASLEKSNDSV